MCFRGIKYGAYRQTAIKYEIYQEEKDVNIHNNNTIIICPIRLKPLRFETVLCAFLTLEIPKGITSKEEK